MFEITPREQVKKEWKEITETSEAIFTYFPPVYKSFAAPISVDGERFVRFEVTQFLRVKPQITTDKDIVNWHHIKIQVLKSELEAIFGKENLRFNEEWSVFTIQLEETIVANYDEKAKHWKFVNLSRNLKKNYKAILPSELTK